MKTTEFGELGFVEIGDFWRIRKVEEEVGFGIRVCGN
jgi:hypothetical protein